MNEWLAWLLGVLVLVTVGWILWLVFRPGRPEKEDPYLLALERWIEGDREEAARLLRQVIEQNPNLVDPYLQLGNLLRLEGQPGKAAILHRGLTIRDDLPAGKKVAVGLALAEDLLALAKWREAGQVLDTVQREATDKARYWHARFNQWYGLGDLPEAARTLKRARTKVPDRDRAFFTQAYVSFQLDRALAHLRRGETGPARARLKDVERWPEAAQRAPLVTALLAAAEKDTAEAVAMASSGWLADSNELEIFLPALRDLLLESGQFTRTIPILEHACQGEQSPPSLWISLALLYEKLGQRDKAIRLLEDKTGHPGLTPNAAAPFLRLLVDEAKGTDLARVWHFLTMPRPTTAWTCRHCGRQEKVLRWFCPACRHFNTFRTGASAGEGL